MRKILYYLMLVIVVLIVLLGSTLIMMAVFGFDGKWVSAFTAGICLSIIYGRKKIFLFLDRIFKVDN